MTRTNGSAILLAEHDEQPHTADQPFGLTPGLPPERPSPRATPSMHPHISLEYRPIFCSIRHADRHSVSHPRAVEEKQTARLAVFIGARPRGTVAAESSTDHRDALLVVLRRYKRAMDLPLGEISCSVDS